LTSFRIARAREKINSDPIYVHGQKTSVSLEDEFWDALQEISAAKGERLPDTIKAINQSRPDGLDLSSAIRLFVLRYFRASA
jgi:predicted DNA-binding ribbon-helix-helix protein